MHHLIYISHHYPPLFCLPFYPHLYIAPLHTLVLPAFPSCIYHTTTHLCFASVCHHYAPFYTCISHYYALVLLAISIPKHHHTLPCYSL
jgi:hypothetical protein